MSRSTFIILYISLFLGHALQAQTAKQSPVKAFVNFHLLTMEDSIPKLSQTVIIKNDKIVQIGASQEVKVPAHALVIDGQHKQFLIPGLTDAHVHLHQKDAHEWVSAFVHSGVTTVLNLKGYASILKLRDRIRNRKIIGPDVYTSGCSGVVTKLKRKGFRKVSLKQIERNILKDKRKGYDFIKVYGQATLKQYEHLLKVAQREGVHAMGHIPRNLTADDALRLGQKSFAHAEEFVYTQFRKLKEEKVPLFAKKAAAHQSWLVANLVAYQKIMQTWGRPQVIDSVLRLPETKRLHPAIIGVYDRDWYGRRRAMFRPYITKVYPFLHIITRHFHQAGVKILAGTDTAFPLAPPGESLIEEITLLVQAGLSPYEALKAATANAGAYVQLFIDKKARFGKIKENYTAHLVVLTSNPLQNLEVLKRPMGVLLRGQWYDRAALQKLVKWD